MIRKVHIANCNNVILGDITVEDNKLNIKYGINGTGKTTIAQAITNSNNQDKLDELQTYCSEDKPEVVLDTPYKSVMTYNEDFVNNVIFKENDEVIGNSFEIFIKTPNYNEKKANLDVHLSDLKKIMEEDDNIVQLRDNLINICGKITTTKAGSLSMKGAYKSLLSTNNLYNIPDELESYKPFITNQETNIDWIDWKTKGGNYDTTDRCPFCSEIFPKTYANKKKVFASTYKKADSKNLKEVVDLFKSFKDYLKPEKYKEVLSMLQSNTSKDTTEAVVKQLHVEQEYLVKRFNTIIEFGKNEIAIEDISNINKKIESMRIEKSIFQYFGGKQIYEIVDKINEKIKKLEDGLTELKQEMGALKGTIQSAIKKSQNDINDFLKTAGINYEIEIDTKDELNTKTILKQCYSEERTQVTNIRRHLSWGEKNAFSLILFMYYSNVKNPDLIILDDPISSFDNNKKYAILHRIFKNDVGKISFCNRTVLFLTHDFEPIIDFIVVKKSAHDIVKASYIWNDNGKVTEELIKPNYVKLILDQCKEISKNCNINIISRIAFLRKLCELQGNNGKWNNAYQILSSLIHKSQIKRKIGADNYEEMSQEDIENGTSLIKRYILDFDFQKLQKNVYTENGIINLYKKEKNKYFQLQIFRELNEISKNNDLPTDDPLFKFIDETYHIENDYLHYLDILVFNIVPTYISKEIDMLMAKK